MVVRDPFGDKGRTVCLAMERTRRAPAGANGFGGRQQGAAVGADSSSRVPKELRELADRVLDMAHRAVVDKASWASAMSDAQRTLAAKAIQHHRPYYLAQAIPYPAGGNHVDGVGCGSFSSTRRDSTFHISTVPRRGLHYGLTRPRPQQQRRGRLYSQRRCPRFQRRPQAWRRARNEPNSPQHGTQGSSRSSGGSTTAVAG